MSRYFFLCARHGIYLTGESPVTGVTAKCSEPQAVDSDVMGEGSGVANLLSLRIET